MVTLDRAPDLIRWKFPYDKSESPTIFHIKKSNAAESVYKALTTITRKNEYDYNDWLADNFGLIAKIENWPDENNNPVTLAEPEAIIQAVQSLQEDDLYVLIAAIHRRGQYDLGLVEKN